MPTKAQPRWTIACACLFLIAITWFVFGQTRHFDFVNYDDDVYVYDNLIVAKGLTLPGLRWAFTDSHARNWHPLTTLSHMADCHWYGLWAGGHHLTNVALHTLGAILLFLVLREMTGHTWRSAFVAGLVAIHPQHVESVAWVAERKDVLSGVFFMLTLGAYVRYARQPSLARYVTMSILFVCGLMSKSMLVTLPFVLLLLDYWPFGRFAGPTLSRPKASSQRWWDQQSLPRRLVIEKIPLFVLSAIAGAVTYVIQVRNGVLSQLVPLTWRIGNALVSCVTYISQMVWPANLSLFYPHPETQLSFGRIAFASALIFTVTVAVILRRRKNPYLFTGWFWYLGMLAPVIGIIQVGTQGWADRYTYLPHIGLYIGVTWLVVDLAAGMPYRRAIGAGLAVVTLGSLACAARIQTWYWRSSEPLWGRALEVTTGNHVAHNNLGALLAKRGELDQAMQHYKVAYGIRSQRRTSGHDLQLAVYQSNTANVLRAKGQVDEAINLYRQALQWQPDYGDALRQLAGALSEKGQIDEAIPLYRRAVQIYRADPETEISLGMALLQKGMDEEAIVHFENGLKFDPKSLKALNNLAWLFATSINPSIRNGPKAVVLSERAVAISGGTNPFYLHKLAAAYAEEKDFTKALAVADVATKLATEQGNSALAEELRRNVEVYQTNSPLRDTRRPK